jgi:GT2 family glycosyltransferase/glycosyltransferase involved in cell wall biosynthesis
MRNPLRFLPEALLARLLVASGIFDWKWYVGRTNAPAQSAREAAQAYVRREDAGDAPNPLFDADWYRLLYGFQGTPAQALLHFRFIGERFGLQPSPWFHNRAFRLQAGMPLRFGSSLARFQRDWREMHTGHPLFDARWYLKTYADSAASGENPLVHFVVHGRHQGRLPNRYFSPQWYLKQYTDVAVARWEPIQHYFEHGAAEGRSPGPDFDAHAYADAHPAQRLSGLDPLGHFLVVGRAKGFTNQRKSIPVAALVQTPTPSCNVPPARGVVDIVIPVYRGLDETRDCIESVLRSRHRVPTRLRIYNDASPEPEVTRYLRSVAAAAPDVILVENDENLGFVGTVNRGMRAALAEPDSTAVLLLNSDTVVAGDWVDRMLWHALADARVGTVTAMSNNATICSYPRLGENEMPAGRSVAQMDAAAALANARQSVEIPTAVGFCMLIARRALESTGLFDEEAFGKGYGEENDFCMRASAAGFRHLLALDVFVRHVGEVSFATTSKPGKLVAERVIAQRYPYYAGLVSDWVRRDPSQPARLRLTFALWRLSNEDVHVIVTHDLGGGTERQVQRLADRLGERGHVVIVRPGHGRSARLKLEATSDVDGFTIEVDVEDGAGLAALLTTMGVTSVQIHHLLGHGELIRDGLARSGLGHEFFVHDYFSVCPQVTLTTARATYCGEPGPAGCDACIRERPSHGASDIRNWRLAHEWAVRGATAVQTPSEDTARRIERYFGVLPEVRPHESLGPMPSKPVAKRLATHRRPLRVVLVGVLAAHKGRDLVIDAATAAQRKQLPLTFHLIGDTQGAVPSSASRKLSSTGWYEEAQLSRLIAEAAADVFLFPAPWPETYSFTLTAAMETGLPIVATDLGAFTERLRPYAAGRLIPVGIGGAALADQLVEWFVEET